MFSGFLQNAEEVWIRPVDEQWIKTLCFLPCYPKRGDLDMYEHMTPFSNSVLIARGYRAHVLVSKEELPHFHNMMQKATIVTQLSRLQAGFK